MGYPVNVKKYPVSTPYGVTGKRWVGGVHKGVDQACPVGTKMYSPVNGVVVAVGDYWGEAFGRHQVVIEFIYKRKMDLKPKKYWIGIEHGSATAVKVGQKVKVGTYIGRSGQSGNATGPHVHTECQTKKFWTKKGYINPQFALDMKKV